LCAPGKGLGYFSVPELPTSRDHISFPVERDHPKRWATNDRVLEAELATLNSLALGDSYIASARTTNRWGAGPIQLKG
jgi:hypothetical protein